MIGEIPDIDDIASRHLPRWREATHDPSYSFVLRRRLQATAIGQHFRAGETVRDYLDEYITLPGREIPIRVYMAKDDGPTTLYFHGGGWVSGNLDTHHGLCCLLRDELRGSVVSVHTRRAPENPFPAQLDDALCSIRFLQSSNGLTGIGPRGLILAGDSAGGLIALHVALAQVAQATGLLLFYPALDPDLTKESCRLHANAPGLTTDTLRLYWNALVGDNDELRRALSLNSLTGLDCLPPAAVMVAEYDPLRDDGTRLISRLTLAGRPAALMVATGATHGFGRMVQRDPRAKAWVEALVGEFRCLLSAA